MMSKFKLLKEVNLLVITYLSFMRIRKTDLNKKKSVRLGRKEATHRGREEREDGEARRAQVGTTSWTLLPGG